MNLDKTIEQLENDYWKQPAHDSHLIKTCHALRKKPLSDFEIEDLRIMLGQNIGLEYLVPLAMEELSKNILAEGDMYEGYLLANLLGTNQEYWIKNSSLWTSMCALFNENRINLENADTTDRIRNAWFEQFEQFEKINTTH